MSKKPRRWELQWTGLGDDFDMVENPKGNYVLMEDYSILKAEVERLEAEVKRLNVEVDILRASSFVTAVSVEQYERVVKAGDAMAECILKDCIHKNDVAALNWYDAKEGKQP